MEPELPRPRTLAQGNITKTTEVEMSIEPKHLILLVLVGGLVPTGVALTSKDGCFTTGLPQSHYRRDMLHYVNVQRRQNQLARMVADRDLTTAAQSCAEYMAERGDLWHSDLRDQLDMSHWSIVSENTAWGQSNAKQVVDDWMDSPTFYRDNVLNNQFTHVGFGRAMGVNRYWYWCAIFGGPGKVMPN